MAKLAIAATLAWRGALAHKLSLVVVIAAVAVGVAFQVPNTANLAGSSAILLEESLVWGAGDVRVEARARAHIADASELARRVVAATEDERATAVLAIIVPGGLGGDGTFHSVPVIGAEFGRVRVAAGAAVAPGDSHGVMLGSALARELAIAVGDRVELRTVLGDSAAGDIGAYTMSVRGIAGNSALYRSVLVDRGWLGSELGVRDAASMIALHLSSHDDAEAVAARVTTALPELRAIPWQRDEAFLPTVLGANRVMERVSYAMVMAAVAVPLLAVFYVRVLQRRRELAVLRALGWTRRELFAITIFHAAFAAVIGAALGLVLARAAIALFSRYPLFEWEGVAVRPLATAATFGWPVIAALSAALAAGAIAGWRATHAAPARVLARLD